MSLIFTSDNHFSHTNAIKYCDRPFLDVKEMNIKMIENWNSIVKENDIVYHLGDFVFTKFISEVEMLTTTLNGKINLIMGNHDKLIRKNLKYFLRFFNSIKDFDEIKLYKKSITLCHYSMRVWNKSHYGSWHLFGHSHGNLNNIDLGLSLDIGVDNFNFYPISFEQLYEIMKKREDEQRLLQDS